MKFTKLNTIYTSLICILVIFSTLNPSYSSDTLDFHVFGSQTAIYSNDNDYLVDDSQDGAGSFQELGLNVSNEYHNSRLFIGMQVLARRFGAETKKIDIDWAKIRYNFNPYITLSLGLNKNKFGFSNESRDIDSTRISILAPQEIYQERLREMVFASQSLNLDGNVPISNYGTLSYHATIGYPNITNSSVISKNFNEKFNSIVPGFAMDIDYSGKVSGGGLLQFTTNNNLSFLFQKRNNRLNYNIRDNLNPTLVGSGMFPPLQGGDSILSIKSDIEVYGIKYEYEDWTFTSEYLDIDSEQSVFGAAYTPSDSTSAYYFNIDYDWNYHFSSYLKYGHVGHNGTTKFPDDTESTHTSFGVRYDINQNFTLKSEYHLFKGGYFVAGDGTFQNIESINSWDAVVFRLAFVY